MFRISLTLKKFVSIYILKLKQSLNKHANKAIKQVFSNYRTDCRNSNK